MATDDRCDVLMRRVPSVDGQPVEAHAFFAKCGRPVDRDGVCRFHSRPPISERAWRRRLRVIGRGR